MTEKRRIRMNDTRISKYFDIYGNRLRMNELPQHQGWSLNFKQICTRCQKIKNFKEFENYSYVKCGKHHICKVCRNEIRRKRYHEYEKKRYNTVEGKIRILLANAKQRAKKKNIPFDLDKDFLLNLWKKQNGKCKITGLDINLENKTPLNGDGPALDKIDPAKGYIKENVQWLCSWVNVIKSNYSINELKNKINLLHISLNV